MAGILGRSLLPPSGGDSSQVSQPSAPVPPGSPGFGAGSLSQALMPLYDVAKNFFNPSDTINNQYQPYEEARQAQRTAEAAKPYVPPTIDLTPYGK